MANLIRHMWRAALLDSELYDEVEQDPRLAWQSFLVVAIVGFAGGFGVGWPHPERVILGALIIFAGWIGWAVVTNWLGTSFFPGPETVSSFREMVRTIGFAAAPGLLALLGLVPEMRIAAFTCALVWMLAATVIAVREALDYTSTARALMVCAIGWVVQVGAVALALSMLVVASNPAL